MEKNNRLIAEFMGVEQIDKNWFDGHDLVQAGLPFAYGIEGNGTSILKFHTSWDWLMPVANEIIKSRDEQNADWDLSNLKAALQTTNIEMVYKSVVTFIEWYNQIRKCSECGKEMTDMESNYGLEDTLICIHCYSFAQSYPYELNKHEL